MKERQVFSSRQILVSVCVASTFFIAACGDDDSFSPISRNRGYDYAYTSAKDLSKTPCDSMRNGRTAVIGRDKDFYECVFDKQDSVYLWVSDYDTLTAEGREFHRAESSSSKEESSSSKGDGGSEAAMTSSSSRYSSSSYSSSAMSSSSLSSGSSSSNSSSSSSSVSSSSAKSSSSSERFSKMDVEPLLKQKGEQFNPNISYGTMRDSRDGKTYRTVVVNGKTWMAENLNYSGHSMGESFCFNLDTAFCNLYGRLYSRDAALNSSSCSFRGRCELGNRQIQGVCPSGWHIPSYAEADSLINFVSGKATALRSAKGWVTDVVPGTDDYGLSIVASGAIWPNNSRTDFKLIGKYEELWVYEPSTNSTYLSFNYDDDSVDIDGFTTFPIHIPVRCISNKVPASSSSAKSSSSFSSSSVSSSSAKSSSSMSSSSVSSSSVSSSSMSSSSEESSSSFDKAVLFNSSTSYGEMMDGRDGKTYKTVNVGGKTWMAENLDFADSAKFSILEGNSRCYDDEPGECVVSGRLYSREAALNDSRCTCYNGTCPSTTGVVQGVCPDGWHIPSKSEAEQLINSVGGNTFGNKLKSSYGWNAGYVGTNELGTSFTGTGVYRRQTGYVEFKGKGAYTDVWIFNGSEPNGLYYLMIQGRGTVAVFDEAEYDPFYPVRCVKN